MQGTASGVYLTHRALRQLWYALKAYNYRAQNLQPWKGQTNTAIIITDVLEFFFTKSE